MVTPPAIYMLIIAEKNEHNNNNKIRENRKSCYQKLVYHIKPNLLHVFMLTLKCSDI